MKNLLLAPIALFTMAVPAAAIVFFVIPHAGFVATFAAGIGVGATAMGFACWQVAKEVFRAGIDR